MQAIERGGYSREEILDVLHSKHSARNVRFRYDLLDKDGVYKKTLETVLSGEVSMSAFSTIKRTAKFKVKERYVPEYWTRIEETKTQTLDTTTDFSGGTHDGTVATSGMVRISSPATSLAPNWELKNVDSTGGIVDWSEWVADRSTLVDNGLPAIDSGNCIGVNRIASGSVGIKTDVNTHISITAGDTVYCSFFFKIDGAETDPTYTYVMTNDGLGNISFSGSGTVNIYDVGGGWKRFDGVITNFPRTTQAGLLLGSSNSSTSGTIRYCNVYYRTNISPIYGGTYITPELDFSVWSNGNPTYVNSDIDYNKLYASYNSASGAVAPTNSVESSVSLDGGQTWSAWSGEGETAINGFNSGDDLSNAKVRFRFQFSRYNHIDTSGIDYLSTWVTAEIDEFVPETTEINYLSDRIQPWMEVKMRDGNWIQFPLGVFLLSTPTRHDEVNGVFRDIEAYDGLVILDDDKFTSRYTISSGTKYTDAVADILSSAGITRFNIQDKTDTLSTDKEFKIGTSKLQAVNDLLSAINYTPIWVDARGYFTAYPYVSPADRRAEYTYADDELSVTYNGMEEELDLTEIANTWVVTQSNPEKTPLTSTKTNDSEDSPTSTVNMGRTIVDFREIDDIADQATLDAYVERIAFEASQVFGKLKFKTALMPFHEYHDVIHVKYDALKIDYKFSETNWTMKLEAGGEMEHEVRRVVSI
jgi:hypothetical protein